MSNPIKDYLAKVGTVESGNNATIKNPKSSATGMYQFTDSTWQGVSKKHNLGYTMEDRLDPKKQEVAMYYFTKDNANILKPILGREPNHTEMYLGHFLGSGGASKLFRTMQANPDAPISSVMSGDQINANKSVVYNKDGSIKTVGQLYDWADKKMGITPTQRPKAQEEVVPTYVDATLLKTSEVSNLADPSLYANFTPQQEKEDPKKKLEAAQNEKNFIMSLIAGTQVQYVDPNEQELSQEYSEEQQFQRGGQIPVSSNGVYDYPEQPVLVPTPSGAITMKNVEYPILGISKETGERIEMQPGKEYFFKDTKTVLEIPQKKKKSKRFKK